MLGALAVPAVGRGLAWGDLDGDGRLDLVLGVVSGAPRVLRNVRPSGRSIHVRLLDPGSAGNRQAIGSRVELHLGGIVARRIVMPTRSYLSQVPAEPWFGLGACTDGGVVEVTWPDGGTTRHGVPPGARGPLSVVR